MIYEVDVSTVPIPANLAPTLGHNNDATLSGTKTISSSNSTATHSIINDNWYTTPSTWYYTYPYIYNYGTKVYMYQLICPKCKTTNWGEIDQVVTCTGEEKRLSGKKISCKATLKAIKTPVDFEIPVG